MTEQDAKLYLQLVSQHGSVLNCLNKLVPEIPCPCFWDTVQARKYTKAFTKLDWQSAVFSTETSLMSQQQLESYVTTPGGLMSQQQI